MPEWTRQLKIQHAREAWEEEQRSMPRKPELPSSGFSPYWNPEVLRANLAIQDDIDSQFATTQKPRFDLQQQRMISATQMMEMAIQRMENAAMAKAMTNVTFPATETKNTHRRSRSRIDGRRQNVANQRPARARKQWSPPKSQENRPLLVCILKRDMATVTRANHQDRDFHHQHLTDHPGHHLRLLMDHLDHRDLDLMDLPNLLDPLVDKEYPQSRHMDHLDLIMDHPMNRNVDHPLSRQGNNPMGLMYHVVD
ncbi:uncharacterized protein LOC134751696 [Cydia strobilella]|uniref:uncharacterized protein LOC134751696 n=1 Tax=Cydia strobilella TaxID=1100964 RepID=UPI003006DEDB